MSELKPCPFCGGEAVLRPITRRGNGGCDLFIWEIGCGDCGAKVPNCGDEAVRDEIGIRLTKDGMADAIASWNRRVQPNGWIKMEDRKPVDDCIAYEATRLGVCLWVHGEWEASSWNITHWHPLPEPPKEKPDD